MAKEINFKTLCIKAKNDTTFDLTGEIEATNQFITDPTQITYNSLNRPRNGINIDVPIGQNGKKTVNINSQRANFSSTNPIQFEVDLTTKITGSGTGKKDATGKVKIAHTRRPLINHMFEGYHIKTLTLKSDDITSLKYSLKIVLRDVDDAGKAVPGFSSNPFISTQHSSGEDLIIVNTQIGSTQREAIFKKELDFLKLNNNLIDLVSIEYDPKLKKFDSEVILSITE